MKSDLLTELNLDLDIKERYELIKDKYPTMIEGIRVHEWPDMNTIFSPYHSEKTKYVFESRSMNSLNDDGITLLRYCDGKMTTQDILHKIVEENNFELSNIANNIIRFLLISEEYLKNITFENEKSEKPVEVEFTGSKEFITPHHFALEITTRCNLKCEHCYRESSPDVDIEDELTYEEIIGILEKMHKIGARHIEVTGGELFLHPRIRDILKYVCENFEFIGLLSNATALTDDMINFLTQYKDKIVWSISLDSYDKKTHDDFRKLDGAFERTCKNIKKLSEKGHAVRVAMSVTDMNLGHVEKTLNFVRDELKAEWFGYNYILPYGRGKDLAWKINQAELAKRITEIDKYSEQYPAFTNRYSEDQVKEMKKKLINCGAGWRTFTMNSKGIIRPCVLMDEGYITIGDILNQDIEDIMKQPIVQKLMDLPWPLDGECKDCGNEDFCKFCAYRGLITNQERIKQGLGLCEWAKKNNVDDFINIETAEIKSDMCTFRTCLNN